MIKKLLSIILVIISSIVMFSCATISLEVDTTGNYVSHIVTIEINKGYAAAKGIKGTRLEELTTYIKTLIKLTDANYNIDTETDMYTVSAIKVSTSKLEYKVDLIEQNLFVRQIKLSAPNIFGATLKEFRANIAGAPTYDPSKESTYNKTKSGLANLLAFGLARQEAGSTAWIVKLHPFTYAFPEIPVTDAELIFSMYKEPYNNKATSSGTQYIVDGKKYYYWQSTVSENMQDIEYYLWRPISLGWNIVAIAAALVVVAIIWLVTRPPKPKGMVESKFPYDPEKDNDNINLPIYKK